MHSSDKWEAIKTSVLQFCENVRAYAADQEPVDRTASTTPACEAEQSGVSFAGPGLVAPGSSASEGVDGPAAACATESGVGAVTRPLTCVQGSCVPEGTHTTNAAAPACEGNNYRDWWLDEVSRRKCINERAFQAERERDEAKGLLRDCVPSCYEHLARRIQAFLQGESREVPVHVEPRGEPRADAAHGEPRLPGACAAQVPLRGDTAPEDGKVDARSQLPLPSAPTRDSLAEAQAPAAVAPLPTAGEPNDTGTPDCRYCGNPTMHMGDTCFGCGKREMNRERAIQSEQAMFAMEAELSALRQRLAEAERRRATSTGDEQVSNHELDCAVAKALGWEVQEQDEGHLAAWPTGDRSKAECPWSPSTDAGDAIAAINAWCKASGRVCWQLHGGGTSNEHCMIDEKHVARGGGECLAICRAILEAHEAAQETSRG